MRDEHMFFFGPRQSWDDPFSMRRLDQDEDVGGSRRSLVEMFEDEVCLSEFLSTVRTEFCRTVLDCGLAFWLPFFLCPRTTIWIC